jgi:hypothetical protein
MPSHEHLNTIGCVLFQRESKMKLFKQKKKSSLLLPFFLFIIFTHFVFCCLAATQKVFFSMGEKWNQICCKGNGVSE